MVMIQNGYVAVRKNAYDGLEWFDMATWAGSVPIALAKSQYVDKQTSGLKAASPVVRIQQAECRALTRHKSINIGPDGRATEKKE